MNNRFKVSTVYRENNSDTGIRRAVVFPNSHSVLFNWNLFKTIIKTKVSRKNVAFSVKYVLKMTKFKYWGFVTAIWFQSLLFYFFLCNCWDVISFTKSKKLNNVLSLIFNKNPVTSIEVNIEKFCLMYVASEPVSNYWDFYFKIQKVFFFLGKNWINCTQSMAMY